MSAYAKIAAAVLLLVAAFWFGHHVGSLTVQSKWDSNKATIAQAQDAAIIERVTQNQKLIDQYAADNAAITKAKNEEIIAVRSALAVSLRRGTGICSGPVATAKANPTGSSNAAGAASGVFREDIDRDIRAAMMEMESVAATARACQAFVRSVQQ